MYIEEEAQHTCQLVVEGQEVAVLHRILTNLHHDEAPGVAHLLAVVPHFFPYTLGQVGAFVG